MSQHHPPSKCRFNRKGGRKGFAVLIGLWYPPWISYIYMSLAFWALPGKFDCRFISSSFVLSPLPGFFFHILSYSMWPGGCQKEFQPLPDPLLQPAHHAESLFSLQLSLLAFLKPRWARHHGKYFQEIISSSLFSFSHFLIFPKQSFKWCLPKTN